MLQEFFMLSDKKMTICVRKFSFLLKAKTSNRLLAYYHNNICIFLYFFYSKDICICLVGQSDFNVSETCLRVAIHETILQCNLLVLFSSIIQKTGTMREKTGIFKPLRIQLKCCSCFRLNFSSIYDMP